MLLLSWRELPIHLLLWSSLLFCAACGDVDDTDGSGTVIILEESNAESDSLSTPDAPGEDQVPESVGSVEDLETTAGDASGSEDTANDRTTEDENTVANEPELPDVVEEAPELTFMDLTDAGDVVEFVEVDRYMGRWYEIATTPSFQQISCYGTQAKYVFNDENGWVDVTNRCFVGNAAGRLQEIQGRAELVDTETQAKLDVIFFDQRSPYWVVALDGSESDEPYQWAVVSGPGSFSMWILSRTPTITEQARAEINAHLEARGFDIGALIDTPHGE